MQIWLTLLNSSTLKSFYRSGFKNLGYLYKSSSSNYTQDLYHDDRARLIAAQFVKDITED